MIIQVNYIVKWRFKEHQNYLVTTCKKIVNIKNGKIVKCVKSGGSIGYYIDGDFFKKSSINDLIEILPKKLTPF